MQGQYQEEPGGSQETTSGLQSGLYQAASQPTAGYKNPVFDMEQGLEQHEGFRCVYSL